MNKNEPVVIDFGLANANNVYSKNNGGGYPIFMPPERISVDVFNRFIKPASYRSDVYQFGLLIAYIITSETPFVSNTWKKSVLEKRDFSIEKELYLDNALWLKYCNLVQRCIDPDPSKRYKNINVIKNEFLV